MPIAVTPTTNYGNKTVSGTTSANALVLLKNPSSGEVVATTTADGSGNYSFTVSNSIPLQVSVPSSVDPQIQTTIDITSPANPYSWYSGGGYVNYSQQNSIVRLGTSNLTYPNGGGIVWTSMPSYRVVDTAGYTPTDPFSGRVVIGSYTETGIGEGAEIELGFANAGDTVLTTGGNPREYTAEEKNFGSIINKVTVKSIGRAYQTPILWISGTSINHRIKSGDPLEGEYARTVNGQEYWARESSSTIAFGLTTFNIPSYVSAYPSDYASRIREYYLNSINGYGEGYTYGSWTGNNVGGAYVQGTRFTAALPGEQDVSEPADDSSVDGATALQDVKDVIDNANYYNGSQLAAYFAIIYGQNPNDITHTGNPAAPFSGVPSNALDGGAVWAYNQNPKIISKQELDLLKGYFGRKLMVEPISSILPTTAFWNSYTAATVLLGAWNLGQGVFQTSIVTELVSFIRQYNGVVISDMSQRIKPILDKITAAGGKDFNTLQTQTNSGQRVLWNFNGTEPTNSNL